MAMTEFLQIAKFKVNFESVCIYWKASITCMIVFTPKLKLSFDGIDAVINIAVINQYITFINTIINC